MYCFWHSDRLKAESVKVLKLSISACTKWHWEMQKLTAYIHIFLSFCFCYQRFFTTLLNCDIGIFASRGCISLLGGIWRFSLGVGVWSVADNGTVHFLLSLPPLPPSDMASVYFCHFCKSRGLRMQGPWHWFRLGKRNYVLV